MRIRATLGFTPGKSLKDSRVRIVRGWQWKHFGCAVDACQSRWSSVRDSGALRIYYNDGVKKPRKQDLFGIFSTEVLAMAG
jgi:hypothetical protein